MNSSGIKWALSLLLFSLTPVATGQAADTSLFLVSGFPRGMSDVKIPVELYEVDNSGGIRLASTFANPSSDSIIFDYDDHLLAVTSPLLLPATATIVHFGSGLEITRRSLPVKSSELVLDTRFFRAKTVSAPVLGLLLKDGNVKRISGLLASQTNAAVPDLSQPGCEEAIVEGSFGAGEVWSDSILLYAKGHTLSFPRSISDRTSCALGLQLPHEVESPENVTIFLQINTRRFAVLSVSDEETSGADGIGSRLNHVFNKSAGTWSTIRVPGSASLPRAFGDWLAYAVTGRTASTPTSPTQSQFERSMPGILFIANAVTGKSYTIQTGKPDSEPLLVNDGVAYFRIENTIYKIALGSTEYIDRANCKIVASSPNFEQVHWAFQSKQ